LNGGDSGFQDLISNDNSLSPNASCLSPSPSSSNPDSNANFASRLPVEISASMADDSCTTSNWSKSSKRVQCNQKEERSEDDKSDKMTFAPLKEDEDEEEESACAAADDNDDQSSVISDISCLSSLSDLEDVEKWQANFEPLSWVQQQITSGTNPRQIINEILPNNSISSQVDSWTLWKFIVNILSEPPKRRKLPSVNSLQDVVQLIDRSKKIIILTGAGISVSSGIPDFRSRDGIYARLSVDFPDLPDPQAMFDINYFHKDQRPFFKFAKEIYPGQFEPSICHKFIKQIEKNGKLLRNYTQNIDTLEQAVGIERVITCHGSFKTATCTNCKHQVSCEVIREDIFAQRIPLCVKCPSTSTPDEPSQSDQEESKTSESTESEESDSSKPPPKRAMSVMKPDIVFFGEGLPDEFHDSMSIDKSDCDLLIVIGSSLKVKPVALIPTSIPSEIPQILINREPLPHMTFDVELLGDCDVIVQEICHR
jgi:NAD-dependent deacetylase sirtuin 1